MIRKYLLNKALLLLTVCFFTTTLHAADTIAIMGAMAVEIEGAAVSLVAFVHNKPLVVTRTISDKTDGSATMEYSTLKTVTAYNSTGITLRMLDQL